MFSAQSQAVELQLGAGVGQSNFDLEFANTLTAENDTDTALELNLGYEFYSSWLVELRYMDFGSVDFNKNSNVAYTSMGLNLKKRIDLFENKNIQPYLVAGVNNMKPKATQGLNIASSAKNDFQLGAGLNYALGKSWLANTEFSSYNKNISAFTVGIKRRLSFGKRKDSAAKVHIKKTSVNAKAQVGDDEIEDLTRDAKDSVVVDEKSSAATESKIIAVEDVGVKGRSLEDKKVLHKLLAKKNNRCTTNTNLDEGVKFSFNESELSSEAKRFVKALALQLVASKDEVARIVVEGYASLEDGTTEARNKLLSKQRADNVRNELVRSGVSPSILSAKAFGASNAPCDNTQWKGRQSNRRALIVIISR